LAINGLHKQTFSDLAYPLNVRIPEAVGAELERVAEAENVHKSDVTRYALIRYLMERRDTSGNV